MWRRDCASLEPPDSQRAPLDIPKERRRPRAGRIRVGATAAIFGSGSHAVLLVMGRHKHDDWLSCSKNSLKQLSLTMTLNRKMLSLKTQKRERRMFGQLTNQKHNWCLLLPNFLPPRKNSSYEVCLSVLYPHASHSACIHSSSCHLSCALWQEEFLSALRHTLGPEMGILVWTFSYAAATFPQQPSRHSILTHSLPADTHPRSPFSEAFKVSISNTDRRQYVLLYLSSQKIDGFSDAFDRI